MAHEDVDDIFKDFEGKVDGKRKISKHSDSEEEIKDSKENLSEEELLKKRYLEAERALKEKHRKEKEALKEKRKEEMVKQGVTQSKPLENTERIAYIAIIIVLVAYIAIDLSFYHGKGAGTESETISVSVGEDNKTNEMQKNDTKSIENGNKAVEQPKEDVIGESKNLPGVVTLTIDSIIKSVSEELNDTGYITRIVFTIDNGRDKVLTPFLEVYAYDSENKEDYETVRRRGYSSPLAIKPGDKYTGTIDLVPKTWANLNLKKNIRLTLNDTEDGFITAINEQVLIS